MNLTPCLFSRPIRPIRAALAAALLLALPALPSSARAAESDVVLLGVPTPAPLRVTTNAAENAWLSANTSYAAQSAFSSLAATSRVAVASLTPVLLASSETGFPLERTIPQYYLGDEIVPPDNVDWPATYAAFTNSPQAADFLFAPIDERVFAALGGTRTFDWILSNGTTQRMTYVVSPACSGRPRRIYWTDHPWNAPAIDLSGKFVKFFGNPDILTPVYGTVTVTNAGMAQVISNKIVRGLDFDPSTQFLYVHGQLRGQVVMAYYDTGNYARLRHVQVVEVCEPVVNLLSGEIGRALRPDGRGYNATGLRPQPTVVNPSDGRGEYLYQHKGRHTYSPKNNNVYPLRPTTNNCALAEVYWMEADEMEVEWPFERDQYSCDWPADATVFVRGDLAGDGGRPVYVPNGLTATLMDYQEPEGHARAVTPDGTFETTAEGYSLLRLTADDDIWFFPIRSILRSNTNFFTLAPQEERVGTELVLRGGSVAGLAPGFRPSLDATSPGYIYPPASGTHWNPDLYKVPAPDPRRTGSDATNNVSGGTVSSDTNTYASVVYPVRADTQPIEIWWNTTLFEDGMPEPLAVPTCPQVYTVRWPDPGETPQIVIASQLGSASESVFSQGRALYLEAGDSTVPLGTRDLFDATDGGTVMFWIRNYDADFNDDTHHSVLTVASGTNSVAIDMPGSYVQCNFSGTSGGLEHFTPAEGHCGWVNVALVFTPGASTFQLYVDGTTSGARSLPIPFPGPSVTATIGAAEGLPARAGVEIGEILFWNKALAAEEVAEQMLLHHDGTENHLTACYSFGDGTDLAVTSTDWRTVTDKVLGTVRNAWRCLADANGPPAWGTGSVVPDPGTTARIYVQNDPAATGFNPNEEHALLTSSGEKRTAWALRCDLNTPASSAPGVLVEYARNGRKRMQWFDVVATNAAYPVLGAGATAGLAFPGPHPIDFLDAPWCPSNTWAATDRVPFRDRKGQLWARGAGTATLNMYYRNQESFAYPSITDTNKWPAVGAQIPWLSLLDGSPASDPLAAAPHPWTWTVSWPENVPEMEIGRTLATASSGLPEVWNAKSVAVVWPPDPDEAARTALLFDPTVEQTAGTAGYTVKQLIDAWGIKSGAGGHATLRKGKWYFDDLPPNLSSRFYLDTTADPGSCLKLAGEMEDNPGAVSLLHVNVLSTAERDTLSHLVDDTAGNNDAITLWQSAIAKLATNAVTPSVLSADPKTGEAVVAYAPRDHYALFSMGATNYVTLIENDATKTIDATVGGQTVEVASGVSDGDPISMHVIKVVPKYHIGRVVTRTDKYNLLSQQLSVLYEEAFAGDPDQYEFEWRKARPMDDGTIPTAFDDPAVYSLRFPLTNGLTRFVIGAQGDTLANMVNTYYSVRYRAASTNSPAWAAMGDAWSDWSSPPALAEGWVQRVLNSVTPFYQRMRDLYENPVETEVSMIVQAGPPYEGDVALNQDNLASVGLIQLYETLLSKAESMSLSLKIDDTDANKQLQLAVGRLADMYGVLGDEAWTDALNPTISFGANFNTAVTTGFELDYGALSSTLFAFDNQVPTLLDEELALLRGRTGDNAPAVTVSPYYNRLVWNFTRGITAGEVAYAVNYDITGSNKGVIDAGQAALQFPQGHGDAYGHYLSALSAYYRLLRNPYFSWGKPAMGELVVNDAVVNADEYDEAHFASVACDVAKVAAAAADRTARKAFRDNGGATGAGYLDVNPDRAFGYGEWASRGGFGALCNWAVANSLLPAAPDAGKYVRFAFTNHNSAVSADIPATVQLPFRSHGTWTLEFQLVPSAPSVADLSAADPGYATPLRIEPEGDCPELAFRLTPSNELSIVLQPLSGSNVVRRTAFYMFTNSATATPDAWDHETYTELAVTNQTGLQSLEIAFLGPNPPTAFPEGFAFTSYTDLPDIPGWTNASTDDDGNPDPYYYDTVLSRRLPDGAPVVTPLGTLPAGQNTLVALVSDPPSFTALLLAPDGAVAARVPVNRPVSANPGDGASALPDPAFGPAIDLGGGFCGEIGELRLWSGTVRTPELLHAKREYVIPTSPGLLLSLRTIETRPSTTFVDEADPSVLWRATSGGWLTAVESGMSLDFNDEGLKRIDRASVPALPSLANLVPEIQRTLDRLDSGLNPLGLSSGAIPFDLSPVADGDENRSHFEQIRERAATALANARRILERAQAAGNRLRLIQEAQAHREDLLASTEQEFTHRLVEYYGYPYEGDIGPGKTYEQGYDGPDLVHYAWMDLDEFGISEVKDTAKYTTVTLEGASSTQNFSDIDKIAATNTYTFTLSPNGFILKPGNIAGKRRARGRIQDALADFLCAYSRVTRAQADYDYTYDVLLYEASAARRTRDFQTVIDVFKTVKTAYDSFQAVNDCVMKCSVNCLEFVAKQTDAVQASILRAVPDIVGVGLTVNTDPQAVVSAAIGPGFTGARIVTETALLTAKNEVAGVDVAGTLLDIAGEALDQAFDIVTVWDETYVRIRDAAEAQYHAAVELKGAWRELLLAQSAVETVIAEAERILDERLLVREHAADILTKARYNEMFFRLDRNDALSRYDAAFALAQKYTYLAAQAYDYETGLLKADPASGEAFISRIVGARTLGEFDSDGNPLPASDGVKGDGGLASILAELDADWLVLKPRLGINNPQQYATWFSLRNELFRILPGAAGDDAWRTALRKCWVDDLRTLPEFRRYCQPLAGSTATAEPGLVIPFPTMIAFGRNFFGENILGSDSTLDPTWFATHIAAAGVHFVGYDTTILSKTPSVYLVPVGSDRFRAVGDPETVLSWNVVDQVIPAPYPIGATQLDDPDWTPLYDGYTGTADIGAKIRKHPSFRAYYGDTNSPPSDDSLDCTRLVGRSAWNTRWLLIIPAGSLSTDRDTALTALIDGLDPDRDGTPDTPALSDILLGLKTYSHSGN